MLKNTFFLAWLGSIALAQTADAPAKFAAADIHVSAKSSTPQNYLATAVRDGRWELKTATMVDLIRAAYGFDLDKIVGGPNWLELDRFDVAAKVPAGVTPDTQKSMLQALLAERFHLAVHKETRPLPGLALVMGKKAAMKESAGTEESGCKVDAPSEAVEGGSTIKIGAAVAASMGVPATLHLGPGGTIQYNCRNMTMAKFAEGLRSMAGSAVGQNPVVEATGLEGKWNFEIRVSMLSMPGDTSRVTIFDAVEKLGLKLESRPVPTPVLVVDGVDRVQAANPAGTAEILPPIPAPTEFEVASVKAVEAGGRGGGFRFQPGGRVNIGGLPMHTLLTMAFNPATPDELVGVPAWADSTWFSVNAEAGGAVSLTPGMDGAVLAPMMRSLLADRFKLTYHTEERQVAGYSLVAGKPKLKKADPASRISCKFPPPPPGTPAGSQVMTCQNVTMAQFAERLHRAAPEVDLPVVDATGLEGTWDLTLVFSMNAGRGGGGRGAMDATGGPAASDPTGSISIVEALEKQLGLKLEKQKRTAQVYVIDHLEQKPTEN